MVSTVLDTQPTTIEEPLLRLTGIGHTYPGPPAVTALHSVDLEIASGEYVSIMGRSGSGKSTLLNLIGLLDRPTRGSYRLAGRETTSLRESERTALRADVIGFVFQSYQLLAGRTAVENVGLPLAYRGITPSLRRDLATGLLTRVGLGARLSADVNQLSGGERQRVAIARALVSQPRVLLCDEPTGSLDTTSAGQILELLDTVAEEASVIVITHDESVALRANSVLTLSDGVLSR